MRRWEKLSKRGMEGWGDGEGGRGEWETEREGQRDIGERDKG